MTRRFRTLLWKEWKALEPFYILLIVLFIIGLISTQIAEFMDEKPIWGTIITDGDGLVVIFYILTVIACLGSLTREKDDGSLMFLEGLPVGRSSLYIAKTLVTFAMIMIFVVCLFVECMVYEWLSRESSSPTTPWNHLGTFFFISTFLTAFFIAIILPLSFLRYLSLLVKFIYAIAVGILVSMQVPYAEWLNPFSLIQPPQTIEDEWVIPWKHVTFLGIIGVGSWFLGLFLFLRMPAAPVLNERPFHKTIVGRIVIGIFVGFLILCSFGFAVMDSQKRAQQEKMSRSERGIETEKTERFEFVYRKGIYKRLKPLIDEADNLYDTVVEILEADESTTRITVDLTQPLGAHNAGQAYWNKIRMAYPKKLSLDEAKAILGHEITHVIIDRITDGRLEKNFGSTRWFHEGLASYVEFHRFREPGSTTDYDRWLALASSWNEVNFLELINDQQLSSKRDTYLVYPAGLEVIEAMVELYGEECLPQILRAAGRKDAPRKVYGINFWNDACLAAGYDMERIRSQFRIRLKRLREENEKVCKRLPEIKEGKANRLDGKVVITPKLPEGWRDKAPRKAKLIARIRPNPGASPMQWRHVNLDKDEKFVISALHFLKPNIGFQVGWKHASWCDEIIFGEWIEVKTD